MSFDLLGASVAEHVFVMQDHRADHGVFANGAIALLFGKLRSSDGWVDELVFEIIEEEDLDALSRWRRHNCSFDPFCG